MGVRWVFDGLVIGVLEEQDDMICQEIIQAILSSKVHNLWESKNLCTSSLIPRKSFTAKLAAGSNGRVRILLTPRTIRGGQVLTKRRHLKTEVNGQESANSLWPGGWERHGRSA